MANRSNVLECITICIAGVGIIWRQLILFSHLRSAQDIPRSNIGTAAAGLCAFEGFAWPVASHKTIYDNKKVVYYYFELQEYRKTGGRNSGRWYSIYKKEFNGNFLIIDPSGIAEVATNKEEIKFENDGVKNWSKLTDSQRLFYKTEILPSDKSLPVISTWFGLPSNFQVIEHFIRCGGPAYVSGLYSPSAPGKRRYLTTGLNEFRSQVFSEKNRSLKNLNQLLDLNRDGQITELEFAAGYGKQGNLAIKLAEIQSEKVTENINGIILRGVEYPLIVYDTHRKYLSNRFGFKMYGMLLFGIIILSFGIYLLFEMRGRRW